MIISVNGFSYMKGDELMVKSMNDLINALKLKFGEDNSDDTISILEDVTDTLTDYESKVSDKTDWKNTLSVSLVMT